MKIPEKARIRAFAWHKYKQTYFFFIPSLFPLSRPSIVSFTYYYRFAFSYQNSKVGLYHLPSECMILSLRFRYLILIIPIILIISLILANNKIINNNKNMITETYLIALGPSPLNHEFMKDICCMEWRPNAGAEIAIGCR